VVNTWQYSINGELTVGQVGACLSRVFGVWSGFFCLCPQVVYWVSRFYRIPPGLLTLRRSDRPGEEIDPATVYAVRTLNAL
jgi:hypothetical protein